MTQAVAKIHAAVEQLSALDRVEFRRAIVERIPVSDDLTDEYFAALAADMLRTLDAADAGSLHSEGTSHLPRNANAKNQ